jgi:hypothetical protein
MPTVKNIKLSGFCASVVDIFENTDIEFINNALIQNK